MFTIYNSRNSQYFQRVQLIKLRSRIYNSRNSQYFQRSGFRLNTATYLQQQKFLVLPKAAQRQKIVNIYNSRNSQYFQRKRSRHRRRASTTVEILSTSKGHVAQLADAGSTTVEILSTSKGPRKTEVYYRSTTVEILSTSKGSKFYLRRYIIYNSRNSQYFQRRQPERGGENDLQQQKFLVLPKETFNDANYTHLQQQKFLVLPKAYQSGNWQKIYNSRNSQYFQRFKTNFDVSTSTTVEILSTSKD